MNAPRKDSDLLLTHKVIDAKRLLYFYHVAKTGRFTSAEALLNVAQSAISRQLQQLEHDLGVQLFDRNGRGVKLTPAGALLFDHAQQILHSMSATVDALQDAANSPQINVSIAGPPSSMSTCMSDLVAEFMQAFPDGRIRVVEASTGGVYNSLVNGEVDLAIVIEPNARSRFEIKKLSREELYLTAAPSHPLAARDTVPRSLLKEHALLLPASLYGSRAILKPYLDAIGLPLRSNVEVDSLPLMKDLLFRQSLCTILPAVPCWEELRQGTLIARPLRPALHRTLYLARLKDKPVSESMRFVERHVARIIREKSESYQLQNLENAR